MGGAHARAGDLGDGGVLQTHDEAQEWHRDRDEARRGLGEPAEDAEAEEQ